MEPSVVVVLVGAALAVLVVLGQRPAPEREPIPVRVDDDEPSIRRG
jgi:hypothetical protein